MCAATAAIWHSRPVAVTADLDDTVRVWDLADSRQMGPELNFPTQISGITALAATPDGRLLVGFDREVAVFAMTTATH